MFKKEKQKNSIYNFVQEVKLRALKIHNLIVPTKAIKQIAKNKHHQPLIITSSWKKKAL
jgi:5,10-methenyltetrahydromethanopterin hydrogenase